MIKNCYYIPTFHIMCAFFGGKGEVIMFQLILNGAIVYYTWITCTSQDKEHKPILQVGNSRMIFRHARHKPLTVKFPDKCEWQIEFKPDI